MNPHPGRQRIILSALLIAASTFVLFSGALNNDFIGWDDEPYVLANPYITPLSPAMVWQMFSHVHFKSWTPLTLLSHAVDYSIWGLDSRGHHLTNIVLHSLNAVWVFLLSLAILRAYRRRSSPDPLTSAREEETTPETAVLIGAVVSALSFACLPLRVESVACASSRKDLLSAFFAFPALLTFMVYAARRGRAGAGRWYAGSLGLFALALIAKGSVMTLAGLLVILDLITGGVGGGRRRWWRLLRETLPFLLVGLAAALVAYVASGQDGSMAQVLRAQANVNRIELGCYHISFYVLKTVWPVDLAELYTYPPSPWFIITWLMTPALTLGCVILWWRGYRCWLYAWSCYLVALLPMAGFVPSSIQLMANRYVYFAATPFAILLGGGITSAWASVRNRRRRGVLIAALALPVGAILLAQAALTISGIRDWRDAETVWRHTLLVSPRHALAHNQMGLALEAKSDLAGAVSSFNRAIEIYPGFSEGMVNLGGAYIAQGDTANAERVLRASLAINAQNYAVYTNLGNLRTFEGRFEDAAAWYRQSLALNPASSSTMYSLGYAIMLMGKYDEALETFSRVIKLNPNSRNAYFLTAQILRNRDEARSLEAYRQAARLGHAESQRILAGRGMNW
jgi:tetratricopeptide (TPR) repeat protein